MVAVLTQLEVTRVNLTGTTLPTELGNLGSLLKSVSMWSSDVGGTIPSQVTHTERQMTTTIGELIVSR